MTSIHLYACRCIASARQILPLCALFFLLQPVGPVSAETWAIYWYLCGSNLETEDGAASADLAELLSVRLPDNVTVVIQTGGSREWHSHGISPRHIGRYVYRGKSLERIAQLPQANMGDEKTLESFMAFCKENFSADHQVFIFWDHGGGSIGGLANDENFDFDSLSLKEIRTAFSNVHTASTEHPPFEIVGFDACLMATLDTAGTVSGFARYMVASQDVEPANGWQYSGWLGALAADTTMTGVTLGKSMCDTYLQGCRDVRTEGNATLSLVDLARIPFLSLAYNALGLEAVTAAMKDDGFYASYGRLAKASENYMNSRSEGFTNMVDLGSLVQRLKTALPEFAPYFLDSLREAVLYTVHGPYRAPSGLSCYYPFDGNRSGFNAMMETGNITTFLVLNGLQLGFLDADRAVEHLERISSDISAALDQNEADETDNAQQGGQSPQAANTHQSGALPPSQQGYAASALSPLQSGLAALTGGHTEEEGASPSSVAALFGHAASAVVSSLTPLRPPDISSLEDFEVSIGNGGEAVLNLGPERVKYLDSIQFYLAYYSLEDDLVLLLGKDSDMEANWESGVFKDNFQGKWAALDGHLVYMENTHQDEGFNHYAVPIKLNGVRCNLVIVYDFSKAAYRILGARRVYENSLKDKSLIKLKSGDRVTTILLAMPVEGENEFQEVDVDDFTLGPKTVFEDVDMGDGKFMFMFEMTDVQNNAVTSEIISISVQDGQATYEKIR